jgi:hypothetical protein
VLDPKIIERARSLIHAEWPDKRAGLDRELSRIVSQASAAGRLRSGNTVRMLQGVAENELKARAHLVLNVLQRVHNALGAATYDGLANDLKQEAEIHINENALSLTEELKNRAGRLLPDMAKRMSLMDAQSAATAKVNAEIDLYVDSLAARNAGGVVPHGHTTVNISGTIGAVQTAPGAFASVTQHIGAEDKAEVLAVLAQLEDRIEQAADIAPDIKRELQGLIPETAAELNKERPALIKVKSLLQGIATTIQTLGSTQPAYQALKVALVPLGISLP